MSITVGQPVATAITAKIPGLWHEPPPVMDGTPAELHVAADLFHPRRVILQIAGGPEIDIDASRLLGALLLCSGELPFTPKR